MRLARSILLVTALTAALPAAARGWQFPATGSGWGRFAAGITVGLAAHETGHLLTLRALGEEQRWHGLSITYDGKQMDSGDHLRAAAAGLESGWLAAEAALTLGGEARTGDFGAGVVWAHLGTSAAYLTLLMRHPEGDVEGISQATGMAPGLVAGLAAVPALLDAWRLHHTDAPTWVRWLARGWKGCGIGWTWSY